MAVCTKTSQIPGTVPETHLIVGSTIGNALAEKFAEAHPDDSIMLSYHRRKPEIEAGNIALCQLDATSEESVTRLCGTLDSLDSVIICTGFLHDAAISPEKTIRRTTPEHLQFNIAFNTLPTLLLAKHSFALMKKSDAPVFAAISAKVGSIEDNRLGGWYSYRASKAALNMIIKTLSIEWQRALPRASVAALHPGTVATPLSQPFSSNAKTVFSPSESATYLKSVIDQLTPHNTGRFWSWDGSELPW